MKVVKREYQGYSINPGVEVECSMDYSVGDIVLSISNGLWFKVENNKMWKLMKESNRYAKELEVAL